MPSPADAARQRLKSWLALGEAAAFLLLARIAVALVPFRTLVSVVSRPPRRSEISGRERNRARREVSSAVARANHRLLGRTTCLHRAMTAQSMLRRRGVAATLYYGAATLPGKGLTAHAWVSDGAKGIVGFEEAPRYTVLARYPESGECVQDQTCDRHRRLKWKRKTWTRR